MSDNNDTNSSSSPSLSSQLRSAITELQTTTTTSNLLRTLLDLQTQISSLHLVSRNETLDDVSTPTLPLLTINHYLGVAYAKASTTSSAERFENVTRALEWHDSYLRQMDDMGDVLSKDVTRDYHKLLADDDDDGHDDDNGNSGNSSSRTTTRRGPTHVSERREDKISRFRRKQSLKKNLERLDALSERRGRLQIDENDALDGWDGDGLRREVGLSELRVCAEEAIDEIWQGRRELEMLTMAVEMERRRITGETYMGTRNDKTSQRRQNQPPPPQHQQHPQKPLSLTHITQNPQTGELILKKEQIKSQVFRPGWNQPTMSLEEYGDRERAKAMERSERQKMAEAEAQLAPRRYEQLVRDGMEDDADLVDASAVLDRKWDEFREENPRGIGNKMGELGDRNF